MSGQIGSPAGSLMQRAALDLAERGWAVFPCHASGPRAKAPCTPHGHLNATRDPETIRRWWSRYPGAMIGAPVPDSFIVQDIDPRNGGSVEALETLVGALPMTLTVWSGRGDGGRHLYYLKPPGTFASARLPVGIDLKVNGYCILPPSIHPISGQPYRWEMHEPVRLPPRLRELLRPLASPAPRAFAPRGGNGDALVRFVARLTPSRRNTGLFWAACRAAEGRLLEQIAGDLIAAATTTGLTKHEAQRTVDSAALRAGIKS